MRINQTYLSLLHIFSLSIHEKGEYVCFACEQKNIFNFIWLKNVTVQSLQELMDHVSNSKSVYSTIPNRKIETEMVILVVNHKSYFQLPVIHNEVRAKYPCFSVFGNNKISM